MASSPCFLWYQQNPEIEDLEDGAGVRERLGGGFLTALERGGSLEWLDTTLTGASLGTSARMLAAADETLF